MELQSFKAAPVHLQKTYGLALLLSVLMSHNIFNDVMPENFINREVRKLEDFSHVIIKIYTYRRHSDWPYSTNVMEFTARVFFSFHLHRKLVYWAPLEASRFPATAPVEQVYFPVMKASWSSEKSHHCVSTMNATLFVRVNSDQERTVFYDKLLKDKSGSFK
ncbi:uncharacterized protein [Scyliorhinus torazame]|uniref:uncharacterized protein isoform X2 n=1 Tax=Scyliorhinus torazame TaxID=75743 RepID=UPI003B58BB92